ncbi:MAG: FKBP-type peptidyl-prolyl cis-trans isomerase, partial [Bacteroidales bacterium]|nr:FKBP-type peptidyl-prolyl cis-trans isomerase [Bacteroidales bacterium]
KIAEKEKIAVLKQEESQKIQNYLEEKGIKTKARESGLYYILIKEGIGPQAIAGNTVKVHYTGTFLNGDKFDSSLDRGEPIEFVLGQGRVIKGWDEGIALMKVGEKAKFIIPSEIAYGERGGGAIPPVTPLVFEVELVEVK